MTCEQVTGAEGVAVGSARPGMMESAKRKAAASVFNSASLSLAVHLPMPLERTPDGLRLGIALCADGPWKIAGHAALFDALSEVHVVFGVDPETRLGVLRTPGTETGVRRRVKPRVDSPGSPATLAL